MSETFKQLDLERIQGLLVDRLCRYADRTLHISVFTTERWLIVDMYGQTSQGPCMPLQDLTDIQSLLLDAAPSGDGHPKMFISAGERPDDGWTYIRVWIDTTDLKDEVCTINEK